MSTPDASPVTTRELFAEWAGCMSLDNWNQSNMVEWANKPAGTDTCETCHVAGQQWFYATQDNEEMFNMNRTELWIGGFFAVNLNQDGSGGVVPAIDKLVRMGDGSVPGSLHPTYNTDIMNDPSFSSLNTFYVLTNSARTAGTCGPPEFNPL